MRRSSRISSIMAVEDVPLRRFDLQVGCATPPPLPLPFMVVVPTVVLSCEVYLDLVENALDELYAYHSCQLTEGWR